MKRLSTFIVASAIVLTSFAADAAETKTTPFKGATRIHRTGVNVGGAVQDYNVVIIDMAEPTLRLAVSPQVDRNKTTSAIAKKHKAKLAVNGSFFTFNDREPCGATMAAGAFWTNPYPGCSATMAFSPGNAVTMVNTGNDVNGPLTGAAAMAKNAISGKPWVLKNGASTGPWNDPSHINDRNPRTAIGFTAGGSKVIFLVADGRQTGASGMVGNDIVTVMKEFGATDAMNLDGGGSTALYINAGIVNDPSDGAERAVSNAVMVLPATPAPPTDAGADAEAEPASTPPEETTSPDTSPTPTEATPEAGATEDAGGCNTAPGRTSDAFVFALVALGLVLARRQATRAKSSS